jgi:hypothetical protein
MSAAEHKAVVWAYVERSIADRLIHQRWGARDSAAQFRQMGQLAHRERGQQWANLRLLVEGPAAI